MRCARTSKGPFTLRTALYVTAEIESCLISVAFLKILPKSSTPCINDTMVYGVQRHRAVRRTVPRDAAQPLALHLTAPYVV